MTISIFSHFGTLFDMIHTYSFLDIVFTSFLWQNQIKLIKLCILIKCGDFIAWACRYYLTTYLYLIWRMPDLWLSKYEHYKIFTLNHASSLICMPSLPKTIGHIFGSWAITVPHMTYITHIVFEILCLQVFCGKIKLSPAHYAYQLNLEILQRRHVHVC